MQLLARSKSASAWGSPARGSANERRTQASGPRQTYSLRELGDHDGRRRVLWSSGQALPQVLRDVRHEGVEQLETRLETGVEGVLRRDLGGRLLVSLEEGLCRLLQTVSGTLRGYNKHIR